jgi:hypothetical protein
MTLNLAAIAAENADQTARTDDDTNSSPTV